jgi:hypothetical protein
MIRYQFKLVHSIDIAETNLDTKPEHSEDNTADNAEIAEPKSERGPIQHGEWNMQAGTNCS